MAVSLEVLPPAAADPATGGASVAEFFKRAQRRHAAVVDRGRHRGRPPAAPVVVAFGVALNVNVPNVAVVKGVRTATLGPVGQVHLVLAETGPGYVRPVIERTRGSLEPGTDLALLADGYATVTALHAVREADVDVVHR
jgi:5'-nucleotidase